MGPRAISFNLQNQYHVGQDTQKRSVKSQYLQASNQLFNKVGENITSKSNQHDDSEFRGLIKGLDKKTPTSGAYDFKKTFTGTAKDKKKGFLQVAKTAVEETLDAVKSDATYKYRQISSKIQQAKTSLSAGRALLSAKRSVIEIKNKILSKKEDPEELQLALTHAKRMEMTARKKKRHLELEEMVEQTSRRDEYFEKTEDLSTAQDIQSIATDSAEEELSEQEDAIFEEKSEILFEAIDNEELTDEMSVMIAEFGEAELKMLEEQMESLELLEIVDPHMSEEDLEDLKRRHRASENKALAKADMDYIKDMIKLLEKNSQKTPAISGGSGAGAMSFAGAGAVSMPEPAIVTDAAPMSIDVSV